MRKLCLVLAACAALGLAAADVVRERRTLLVHPDEFTEKWVDRAVALGLDGLSIHPVGGKDAVRSLEELLALLETPAYRARIDAAKAKGLEVGYEMHAAGWLLPRRLFNAHPEYFRMDVSGARNEDLNLCVSSPEALEIVARRAVELARRLHGSGPRYHFWLDDARNGRCRCPKCRNLSSSDQQLLFVNRVVAELRRAVPGAQLCYLAYQDTMEPPRIARPAPGVFLEYAPFDRDMHRPLAEQDGVDVRHLNALLDLFGRADARVLEYWLDNSYFSKWRKPPKRFVPETAVMRADLDWYGRLGFADIASFACFLGDDYERLWGEPDVSGFARGR